jgi:RNA polymerase sigma-70 factor (ECF subfamily)
MHSRRSGKWKTTVSISPASTVPDIALVAALRAGEEEAFEEAFRRHYPTVYAVLLRLTGSPEESEDLAQEVFMRLYERPLAGGADVNLGGWLYRVASNTGFNALRSRRRRWDRLLRWARLERTLGTESPNPAVEAERKATAGMIRETLAALPERDRTALILRHSGVSYAEIAAALDVKPGSVGTILARAERALRERYLAMHPNAGEEYGGGQ